MIDGLIPGLGSLFGGIGSAIIGGNSQDRANEANIKSAREQMAFQERMSSTSYQRGMEDMRKAGLNPMLAFSQGGASSPSGASGNSQGFTPNDPVTPAINATMLAQQTKANTNVAVTQAQKNIQESQTSAVLAAKTAMETKLLQKDLPKADLIGRGYNYLKNKYNEINSTNARRQMQDKIQSDNALKQWDSIRSKIIQP